MQQCPKCRTQLTADEFQSGRCQLCGNLLESFSVELPSDPGGGPRDSRLKTFEEEADGSESGEKSTWIPEGAGVTADGDSVSGDVDGDRPPGSGSTWVPDGVVRDRIDATIVVEDPQPVAQSPQKTLADVPQAAGADDEDEDDTWVPEADSPSAAAPGRGTLGSGDSSLLISESDEDDDQGMGTLQLGDRHASEDRAGGDSTWFPSDDEEEGGKHSTVIVEGVQPGDAQVESEVRHPGTDSTWIPDRDHGSPPRDTGHATVIVDGGLDLGDGAAGQTVVTDQGFEDLDGGQTIISDELKDPELSPDMRKTMADNWGGDVDAAARPGMTITNERKRKGKGGRPKPTSPRQSLVIKPRKVSETQAYDPDNDEYELIGKLGEGGMGVVYHARQTSINRDVAIKMLKPKMSTNREQQQKFLAEAVVTGDLDHPNIVPIYDVALNSAGSLFYSMKKVQGTPWLDVIKEKSLHENLEILLRTADAVAFAHARGIVHRDLKPENVMLGGFGEVLVMDWGLAQPTDLFSKSESIIETTSMGGTPAYMAPEMATGPIEAISFTADVYLLGAILYEIVTGRPPHTGKNAMQCLMAAAKNQIVPTKKTGELVEVALKAMETKPADRYQTVKDFQNAVRDYLAHSESIVMADRAAGDLKLAGESGNYEDFSRAVFGFQEAYELWEGNSTAFQGIRQAKLQYAGTAYDKGDLDLAAGLLDETDPDHTELLGNIRAALREREERQARLKRYKRVGIALLTTFVVTVSIASVVILGLKRTADKQRDAAIVAQKEADTQKKNALEQKAAAELAEGKARDAAIVAKQEEAKAKIAEQQAVAAKVKEQYRAYLARIGLAAAQIEENSFDTARALLRQCVPAAGEPDYRNWEWGRLWYLCNQHNRDFQSKDKVNAIAISPDRSRFVQAGLNGFLQLTPLAPGAEQTSLSVDGIAGEIFSVDYSPDGAWIAVGSADPVQPLLLISAQDPQQRRKLEGHTNAVLSVRFNRDGSKLLTASKDKTARLWNVSTGQMIGSEFAGHTWWVRSAEFSPDETQFVTAGQDGIVRVWTIDTGEASPPFPGHDGAVNAAVFVNVTDDAGAVVQKIVSAGYDRRLLLWNPDDVQPFQYENVGTSRPVIPEATYDELTGHTGSVWSLAVNDDHTLVVSGAQDNLVKVWNPGTRRSMTTFRGHSSWVRSCLFGRDESGEWLLSGSHDATCRQWYLNDYEELKVFENRSLEGHEEAVLAANFAAQGNWIVTASEDRTARTWNASEGSAGETFREGHEYLASNIAFFPDTNLVMTAAVDNTVRAWNIETGAELWRRTGTGRSAALALSPSGRLFATGGIGTEKAQQADRQLWPVQIWQTPDIDGAGPQKPRHVMTRHAREVTALNFSPDGKWLVSGDQGGTLNVWNAQTGQWLRTHRNHQRKIQQIAFSRDGRRLFTASADNSIAQWDFATGEEIVAESLKHPDAVLAMSLTEDDRWLASTCADGTVRIWDLQTDRVFKQFTPRGDWDSVSQNLRATLDRRFPKKVNDEPAWDAASFAQHCGIDEATARAILRADAAALGPVEEAAAVLEQIASKLRNRAGDSPDLRMCVLNSVTLAPDFAQIATVNTADSLLEIWNPRAPESGPIAQADFRKTGGLVWRAAFMPDQPRIVTVGGEEARIIQADNGREVLRLNPHGAVSSASFSADGEWIVTSGWDSSVRIWKSGDGTSIRKLSGAHTGAINSACFSSDEVSRYVLTAGSDGRVVLWDWRDARRVMAYEGHRGAVNDAVFSRDNRLVATACVDGLARVYDRETGRLLFELDHRAGAQEMQAQDAATPDDDQIKEVEVLSLALAPNGTALVTGSSDSIGRYWQLVQPAADSTTEAAAAATATASNVPPDDRQDEPVRITQPVLRMEGHTAAIGAVAYSLSGERILTGSDDYTAKVWDIPNDIEATEPANVKAAAELAAAQAVDDEQPAEESVEVVDNQLPDLELDTKVAEEKKEQLTTINAILSLSAHRREVTSVSFSPDGQRVLTGSRDGTAILWPAQRWDRVEGTPQTEEPERVARANR